MDSAGDQGLPSNVERILSELTNQATAIQHHERMLTEILQRLNLLALPQDPPSQEVPELPTPPVLPTLPQPIAAVHLLEPRLPPPERYDGNTRGCRGFITQCSLAFQLQPSSFPTDSSRVAYIITLLTGRALEWATAILENCSPFTSNSEQFLAEMRRVFHHPGGGVGNDQRLLQLTQGTRSVAEMAIEFRTLAAESGWNEQALQAAFHQALAPELKDELAFRDPAPNLDYLIDVAIRVDNRIRDRRSERQQDESQPRATSVQFNLLSKLSAQRNPCSLGRIAYHNLNGTNVCGNGAVCTVENWGIFVLIALNLWEKRFLVQREGG